MFYLSGPISSNGKSIEENKTRFQRCAATLRAAGIDVYDPSVLDVPGWGWEDYMNLDRLVVKSPSIEGLIMIPGWTHSKGAIEEHNLAKNLGKQVLYLKEDENV